MLNFLQVVESSSEEFEKFKSQAEADIEKLRATVTDLEKNLSKSEDTNKKQVEDIDKLNAEISELSAKISELEATGKGEPAKSGQEEKLVGSKPTPSPLVRLEGLPTIEGILFFQFPKKIWSLFNFFTN
jgi:chromosome segregation ATPase